MEKNIVILGANGFIGSHLVNQLVEVPNTQVICFDRFSRGQTFKDAPNIKNVIGDYFNNKDVDKALKYGGYLIHCLSSTNPSTSQNNPNADIRILNRDKEIFDKASDGNFEKIVYVSSGGTVYGEANSSNPAKEDGPTNPKSSYGIAKLATEQYLQSLSIQNNFKHAIYRLTNIYGPGQIFKNGQGVIPAFVDKIHKGKPIVVVGDGESSRDYIYVDDAIKMMINILLSDNKHDVYNIGSGTQTTLNVLIQTLGKLLNKHLEITYIDEPATYVKKSVVSIERYIDEFGEPRITPLQEGLVQTLKAMNAL